MLLWGLQTIWNEIKVVVWFIGREWQRKWKKHCHGTCCRATDSAFCLVATCNGFHSQYCVWLAIKIMATGNNKIAYFELSLAKKAIIEGNISAVSSRATATRHTQRFCNIHPNFFFEYAMSSIHDFCNYFFGMKILGSKRFWRCRNPIGQIS